jgi:hypothetical protein
LRAKRYDDDDEDDDEDDEGLSMDNIANRPRRTRAPVTYKFAPDIPEDE